MLLMISDNYILVVQNPLQIYTSSDNRLWWKHCRQKKNTIYIYIYIYIYI